MRIDGEGFLVAVEGFVEAAFVGVAVAQACPGAEVAGHQVYRFLAVGDGLVPVFEQAMGDGALVVGFGELWIEFDGAGEMLDGLFHVAAVHGLSASAELFVGLGTAAAEPDGPEGMFSHFIDDGVGVFELFGERGEATSAADEA